MGFCSDCNESIRSNFRIFMTTPITRQKLYIIGGVLVALLLVIIVLSVSLGRSSGGGGGGSVDILSGPVVIGKITVDLKEKYNNEISKNLDAIKKDLQADSFSSSPLGSTIWSVGASDCSAAGLKDAVSQTFESIDSLHRLVNSLPTQLTLATDSNSLTASKSQSKVGVLIGLNGGYVIDSRLGVLRMMNSVGATVWTLTGQCSTPWAGDASTTADLTSFGKSAVVEANRLGILLDLAGTSALSIKTILETTQVPVIFNGVAAKSITNKPNNLDDSTLQLMINKGHVAMVSFKCSDVSDVDVNCTVVDVARHINYMANVLGKSQIGLSGNFGGSDDKFPTGLKSVKDLGALLNQLSSNWTSDDLTGLAYGNFISTYNKVREFASTKVNDTPAEAYEPLDELKSFSSDKLLSCYTDLNVRYGPAPSTPTATTTEASSAPSTTAPTTPVTSATTTPASTKK